MHFCLLNPLGKWHINYTYKSFNTFLCTLNLGLSVVKHHVKTFRMSIIKKSVTFWWYSIKHGLVLYAYLFLEWWLMNHIEAMLFFPLPVMLVRKHPLTFDAVLFFCILHFVLTFQRNFHVHLLHCQSQKQKLTFTQCLVPSKWVIMNVSEVIWGCWCLNII